MNAKLPSMQRVENMDILQACAVLAKQLVALRKQKNRSYATGSRISAVGNQQKVNIFFTFLWDKVFQD